MKWFILLLVIVSLNAQAGGKGDDNFNFNHNTNKAYAGSSSSSKGGNSSATSGGGNVNVNVSDESRFFAFATTFPQAHGCLGGVQAGGAGTSGGGFFGIHFINKNCWTSALAEAEANADVRARLKCHGSVFRDAIAFEQTKNKQKYCVDYMVDKYKGEIEAARAAVEAALKAGKLEPTSALITEDIVVAGGVSQEEFEEQSKMVEDKNAQQQSQIEDLERRTREAEDRAAQAETNLQQIQKQQQSKKQALQQLQQQVQQDYVDTE